MERTTHTHAIPGFVRSFAPNSAIYYDWQIERPKRLRSRSQSRRNVESPEVVILGDVESVHALNHNHPARGDQIAFLDFIGLARGTDQATTMARPGAAAIGLRLVDAG